MELSVVQLGLLTLIAVVLVQLVKIGWMGILRRPKPSERSLKVLVFVISVPFGYFWAAPMLPALPALPALTGEPFEIVAVVLVFAGAIIAFLGGLIAAASAVFVTARLVYEKLVEDVLKSLDDGVLNKTFLAP